MKNLQSLLLSIMFFSLLLVVTWCHIACAETAKLTADDVEVQIVWTTNLDRMCRVSFSHLQKGEWSLPVLVSESDAYIFNPVSGIGSRGKKWVVWTQREEKGNFLQWSAADASAWSPAQKIKTGLRENRATTLIVDDENIPWIAWTGTNGTYSDIYWSRWEGNGWSAAQKIHGDNMVPDIDPELSLDPAGKISISWKTVENSSYVTVLKTWNGKQWQTVYSTPASLRNKRPEYSESVIPYPEFVQERHQARLYVKKNGMASSSLLSNFSF